MAVGLEVVVAVKTEKWVDFSLVRETERTKDGSHDKPWTGTGPDRGIGRGR